MNNTLLRFFWQRIFHRAWIVSLVLFVTLGGLPTYGVFGPSWARVLLMLSVLLMWFLPFIFFTKEGRQAMGLKKVDHPRWLGWGLFLGAGASLVVFGIGWVLYGRSADNWYISVLASFSIGTAQMQIPRFVLFLLYTLPAMIFSPIGEEFFFRGMLHESVKDQWGVTVATLVNSIAFGGIHLLHHGVRWDSTGGHLLLGSGLLWVGLMMGLSWLFTVCRQRSGSILAGRGSAFGLQPGDESDDLFDFALTAYYTSASTFFKTAVSPFNLET